MTKKRVLSGTPQYTYLLPRPTSSRRKSVTTGQVRAKFGGVYCG